MKRRTYFQRRARFVQGNRLYDELAAHSLEAEMSDEYPHYRDWLLANAIKQGRGGRMRRALIRAEQKYTALKPAHIRAGQLHRAYARKSR